jgi:MFS family permease
VSEPTPQALRGNVRKVMLLAGAWMFLLLMPVMVPFLQAHDLGMTQVFQLQTVFALAMVTCEVPSGYVSDMLGRKRCLVLASALYGAAFTWLALAEGFWGFVVFELIAALASSLRSGTDVALLYDSLEALGDESAGTRALGSKLFWGQTGETMAALVTTGLVALAGLGLPAIVNACTAWVPLLVCLTLVEPPRRKLTGTHRENARAIARALLRDSPLVRLVLITLVAYGLATLLVVWSVQDYWRVLGIPFGWFGILWAAYNLVVAISARGSHRLRRSLGVRGVVVLVGVLPVVGYAGLALCAPGAWLAQAGAPGWGLIAGGVLFGFLFQASRGLTQVVVRDELNRRVETGMRATANSISSLGVRLAFAGLGPLLGWLIDTEGHGRAYFAFAGLYLVSGVALALPLAVWLGREGAGERKDLS